MVPSEKLSYRPLSGTNLPLQGAIAGAPGPSWRKGPEAIRAMPTTATAFSPSPQGHEQSRVSAPPQAKFGRGPPHQKGNGTTGPVSAQTSPEFRKWVSAVEVLRVPTVAAVRGAAFGGGFELALSCDFLVAADNAVFRCIEVTTGFIPIAGGLQRLAERVGRSRASLLGENTLKSAHTQLHLR